ncbi:hypothetical protein LTR47_000444 [Exophiala xenobiotica]|nr:hypothetical protein LTR41_004220 [Exophiala xenobiotica]KAK5238701.1 hypothetical protein LTR47_000444 [Exophiala xenobiotica]KAK5255622.1 hypothetical protein LTS06_000078 [Exophiala xenobiotica]KAK5262573.1 hypothetical protein LTR40_000079 [Exophiala xenobiotica]KAK5302336.1 hypothetical protein LTR14_000585 [Exophiala xenobiotica]
MALDIPIRSWTKDNFFLSTDSSLIPLDALNNIFASDDFHWGRSLPLEQLLMIIRRSLCFALYEISSPSCLINQSSGASQRKLIGFARWITDMVTVNYLTDVYILPEYRNRRLGVWIMECIDEVFNSMPHLRGMILIADRGSSTEAFYRKHLNMVDLESPGFCMDRKGRGAAH